VSEGRLGGAAGAPELGVMVVAVEPSADVLGAALVSALRTRLGGGLKLTGVGGPRLTEQGLVSAFDPSDLAVVGVFNALGAYPQVLRRARETARRAVRDRPDVAILIDSWGFNLRVARALRRLEPDLPLIKYVAPQVWATRPGRARTLAATVDHLMTIHSFDASYFEREGLATTFVGNPTLNRDFSGTNERRARAQVGAAPGVPILLLLPGSRSGEVDRLMPVYQQTVERLTATHPGLVVVVAPADTVEARVREQLAGWRRFPVVVGGEAARLDLMRAATVALACSGTVTTELALAGCPMVVAYRLDPFTHAVAKRLIRTPYITLFNVAAGAFVAPERVQNECAPDVLAADVSRLLADPRAREAQSAAQIAAVDLMRGDIADPAGAAAGAVLEVLRRRGRI
jgi:lipid-A-disaccharide synthase